MSDDLTRHFLGVDFGTANSFLALTTDGTLSTNPIDFGGDGLRTIVLYKQNPEGPRRVLTFGEQAEHEWGMSTTEEKRSLQLASDFKPDIVGSQPSRDDAEAYLRCLANELVDKGMLPAGRKPHEMAVYLGSPANVIDGYDNVLQGVAKSAGFGNVELVREPVGALVGHLARREFSVREARGGLLVLDFGGGTCDVAFMMRLEIRQAWGDPILGGRLFDDLFFQWFCEQNTEAAEVMEREGDTYYIHWIKCREMKERFSETLARNREASFRFALLPYGRLSDATWNDFLERAARYVPSPDFRENLAQFGPAYQRLSSGEPVDLIGWVRDVIGRGVRDGSINRSDVGFAILTGGSSAWPFVREIVAEELQLPPEKILTSPNPRRAIGEGIALLPVLKRMHERAIREIRNETPDKVEEILAQVHAAAESFLQTLAEELAAEFVALIEPKLAEFRKTGGRLDELEQQIESLAPSLQRRAEVIMTERSPELVAKMNQSLIRVIQPWFQSKQIQWEPDRLQISASGPASMDHPNVPLDDVFMTGLTAISSTIMAVVVGSLCGGAGTAWLATGPIGWIAGAVLGVGITAAVVWGGKDYAAKRTKSIPIPAKLAWLALRKINYDKIKADVATQLMAAFRPKLINQKAELRRHIKDITQAQIDDLGALDHL